MRKRHNIMLTDKQGKIPFGIRNKNKFQIPLQRQLKKLSKCDKNFSSGFVDINFLSSSEVHFKTLLQSVKTTLHDTIMNL